MSRSQPRNTALVAFLSFAVCWALLGLLAQQRGVIIPVHWVSAAGIVAIGVVVVWLGRGVKRLAEGERTTTTPLGAYRTLALARSCILGGALLAGYFGAQVAIAAQHWHAAFAPPHLWTAVASVVASVGVAVVGHIVEEWCRLPPDDDDDLAARESEEGFGPA